LKKEEAHQNNTLPLKKKIIPGLTDSSLCDIISVLHKFHKDSAENVFLPFGKSALSILTFSVLVLEFV
jgi:hypothetical protein